MILRAKAIFRGKSHFNSTKPRMSMFYGLQAESSLETLNRISPVALPFYDYSIDFTHKTICICRVDFRNKKVEKVPVLKVPGTLHSPDIVIRFRYPHPVDFVASIGLWNGAGEVFAMRFTRRLNAREFYSYFVKFQVCRPRSGNFGQSTNFVILILEFRTNDPRWNAGNQPQCGLLIVSAGLPIVEDVTAESNKLNVAFKVPAGFKVFQDAPFVAVCLCQQPLKYLPSSQFVSKVPFEKGGPWIALAHLNLSANSWYSRYPTRGLRYLFHLVTVTTLLSEKNLPAAVIREILLYESAFYSALSVRHDKGIIEPLVMLVEQGFGFKEILYHFIYCSPHTLKALLLIHSRQCQKKCVNTVKP